MVLGDGVFFLGRPSADTIRRLIESQRDAPLSYSAAFQPGRDGAPPILFPGAPVNHISDQIGSGEADFARAVAAVQTWRMYDLDWTEIVGAGEPTVGLVYAALAHHLGIWSVNCCRVVERRQTADRFSFTVGTLPSHAECGEERFTVALDRSSGDVTFEIFALATARHPLAKLGSPYVRLLQRRFARQALAALRQTE